MRRDAISKLAFGGLSLIALLVAHVFSYVLAVPHAHVRHQVLETTGHGPQWTLRAGIVATVVVAIAGMGTRLKRIAMRPRFVSLALTFGVVQLVGFVVLEAFERASVGVDVVHLLEEGPFLLGLLMQVVAALVAACLVLVLRRAVAAFTRLLRVEVTKARRQPFVAAHHRDLPPVKISARAWGLRGPPAVSSSAS